MDMYNVVMFFVGLTVLTCLTLAATALAIRINHMVGSWSIGRQCIGNDTVYSLRPRKQYVVTQEFVDSCEVIFYRGQVLTLLSVQYNLWDRSYQVVCKEATVYLHCDTHRHILNGMSQYFMAAPISAETHAAIKRLYSVVL